MVKKESRKLLPSPVQNGGVAQLGEHLPCKQGVRSSILLISTTFFSFWWKKKRKQKENHVAARYEAGARVISDDQRLDNMGL